MASSASKLDVEKDDGDYLQCNFTGGSFKWFEISVFLMVRASSRDFPFTHSLATELEAIAEPQPNVLNFASTILPSATLIYWVT